MFTRRQFLYSSAALFGSAALGVGFWPDDPRVLRVTSGNAAWSWWTWPRAVQLGETLYVGSAGAGVNVDETDLTARTTRTWSLSEDGGDDHKNPAVIAEEGKPALAFYTQHASDPYLRVRKGSGPVEDGFGPLGPETLIEAPHDRVTYTVAHVVDGVIHLWFKNNVPFWAHCYSTDWGDSWSDPQLVFKGDDKLYCAFHQVGSKSLVALTTHPYWNGTQAIHATEVDYQKVGGLAEIGSLPVLAEPVSGYRTWMYDVSDQGVLWSSFDPDDIAGTSVYLLTDWMGETSAIASTGGPFLDDGKNFYLGGAQFGDGSVIVSRHDGRQWLLEDHRPDNSTVLVAESDGYGMPVRAWPVTGGDGVAVNMLRRFDKFNDYDSYIGLVS